MYVQNYCTKCGTKIDDNSNFCTNCGTALNNLKNNDTKDNSKLTKQQINALKDYQKPWLIILMLIVFFPIGLYLMWKYSNWNKITKWIITGIIGLLVLITLISSEIPVEVPNVIDKNYSDAKKILEDKGFTNIDLIDKKGTTIYESSLSNENIIIKQAPKGGEKITTGTKIELQIRDIGKEKEEAAKKEQEIINKSLKSLINKDLKTATSTAKALKYNVNLYNNQNVKMNDVISENDYTNWIVTKVKSIDSNNKTVILVVNSKEAIQSERMRKELESKISETNAYIYLEEYGKKFFPYGFKLHYILGNHSAYAKDFSTWIVKSECSITNGFGATRKSTCEAKVQTIENGNKVRVYDFLEY